MAALTETWQLGDKIETAGALVGLAGVALARGQTAHAARLLAVIGPTLEETGASLNITDRAIYGQLVDTLQAQQDQTGWREAWVEGEQMDTEQAVAYALKESSGAQPT